MNKTILTNKKAIIVCLNCGDSFCQYKYRKPMFCSKKCANSSPIQLKKKVGKYYMQRKDIGGRNSPTFGKRWKINDTSKMSLARVLVWSKAKLRRKQQSERMSGENNYRWIKDRSKLKDDSRDRGGSLSRDWAKKVKERDNGKCHFDNKDCCGRLESHHILGWTAFPELRYEISNGITLCHFHHPRKRSEESRLSPYFQEVIRKLKN